MTSSFSIFIITLLLDAVFSFGAIPNHAQNYKLKLGNQKQRNLSTKKFHRGQPLDALKLDSLLSLRGGQTVDKEIIAGAWDWCSNLGAPAALVAGAVVSTIYEKNGDGSYESEKGEKKIITFFKRLSNTLMFSAFTLEIVSIFVTTVTGTMLSSFPEGKTATLVDTTKSTALGFLKANFEFEYLTSRITFLQGLLNWIAAIAIDFAIPKKNRSEALRLMDKSHTVFLSTAILMILSFYNTHANFYGDYFSMLTRWFQLLVQKYFVFRPLPLLIIPSFVYGTFLAVKAFTAPADYEAE